MRRRILAIMASAAVLLAACGTVTATDDGGTNTPMTNGITVTGTGEVSGVPDTISIDLGISLVAPSVAEATQHSAQLTSAVIDALRNNGVASEDTQTTNYSIYPEYDYSAETPRITGYRVVNTVRAKVRDIDNAGAVIDAATAAGGDSTVVNGVWFDIEDDDEMMAAAREAAWNDAHAKAQQLATLAGVSLGSAGSISEVTAESSSPITYDRAMLAAEEATPIEAGTQVVTVTITVRFSID